MKYYVYVLRSSENSEIFYVGKGCGNRMYKHITIASGKSKNKSKNPKLYNKINSIINKGFYIITEVIFESIDENLCLEYEIKKISELGKKNLCNLTDGGEGTSGYKLSDKTKNKISESKKGKKRSDETKQKIRASLLGRKSSLKGKKKKPLSEETKLKMSEAHKGKVKGPRPDWVKDKIRNSMLGNKNWKGNNSGIL